MGAKTIPRPLRNLLPPAGITGDNPTHKKTKEREQPMFKRIYSLVLPIAMVLLSALSSHAGVTVIAADEIQKLLKKEPKKIVVLDVRTWGEYAMGRIPGSLFMPMREVPGRMGELPRDKKIIVVCATGVRSAAVADYLARNGYPDVRNYSGGISDWAGRGLKLEK